MKTREEALAYALSFPKTYQEAPFHDNNWQLVRVEGSKKAFLWTYEREGYINLNVKADPQWRDFWRSTYASVNFLSRLSTFTLRLWSLNLSGTGIFRNASFISPANCWFVWFTRTEYMLRESHMFSRS